MNETTTATPLEINWRRQYSLGQTLAIAEQLVVVLQEMINIKGTVRAEGSEGWVSIYSPKGSVDQIIARMMAKLAEDPTTFTVQMRHLEQTGETLVNFAKGVQVTQRMPLAELFASYKAFFDHWTGHIQDLWKSFYFVEAGGKAFEHILAQHFTAEKLPLAIQALSRPSKKAHVMRVMEHFKKTPRMSERVAYVRQHYPWIFSTDPHSPLPTDKQIEAYAASFALPVDEPVTTFNIQSLPAEARQVITTYQDMLYLKDKRDEYRRQAFYCIAPLVEELAQRLHISSDDLWYILPKEIERFETDRDRLLHEIKQRRLAYLLEIGQGQESLVGGEKARQQFIETHTEAQNGTVQGVSGSNGKVTGQVHIVRSLSDIENFPAGRVLVSTTTNPDYVAAMQRALAFVTDEGGITSHAAIVAREMKKPCVVGTKVATKTFKDGDMVEVDAKKGIVRKI